VIPFKLQETQKAGAYEESSRSLIITLRVLCSCFEGSQLFHQAALTARSVVSVNNTLLSSFIEGANSLNGCCTGGIYITALDCQASFLYMGASATTIHAVMSATLQILPISFNLRLYVSQVKPPELGKFFVGFTAGNFTRGADFCLVFRSVSFYKQGVRGGTLNGVSECETAVSFFMIEL
jgi:hypothetical protein